MSLTTKHPKNSYTPLLCAAAVFALYTALDLILRAVPGAELTAEAAVALWLLRMGLSALLALATAAMAFALCVAVFRCAKGWKGFSSQERRSALRFILLNLLAVLFILV